MVVSHILLFKTPWGLRLRAAGESTEALAAMSLSRAKWQYLGVLLSGVFAAIGGCFLASEVHYFTKGMTAGRGVSRTRCGHLRKLATFERYQERAASLDSLRLWNSQTDGRCQCSC